MPLIKVIVGSTRPGRFGPQPAKWFFDIAKKRHDVTFELLDLQTINLPLLDEAVPPSMQKYANEHTKAWSKIIGEADGFVFVTPEYNHSMSGALKNAIDFLFHEWNYKAAAFVSYGGGAGGSRAVEHLRGVAAEVKLFQIRESVLIPNYWTGLNEKGEYQFTPEQEAAANAMLDELVFWTAQFQRSRKEKAAGK